MNSHLQIIVSMFIENLVGPNSFGRGGMAKRRVRMNSHIQIIVSMFIENLVGPNSFGRRGMAEAPRANEFAPTDYRINVHRESRRAEFVRPRRHGEAPRAN